jgi:hypothetical protein
MKQGIIWILLLTSTAAFSQMVLEKPVPFDGAGKVLVVTRALRDQLRLFPEVRDFASARLLQSEATVVLEVTLTNGDRERTMLSADERDKLRRQVESHLAATPSATINQKGRGLFLLSQLPIAMGWYSTALNFVFGWPRTDVVVSTYLLGTAGFYFVPLLMTRNSPMSEAQAVMSVDYGYYGALNSFAITTLFGMGSLLSSGTYPDWTGRARAGILLATSIGGQFGGYYLGRQYSLGQARYASLLTDCGMVDGLFLGTFVQTFGSHNTTTGNHVWNSILTLAGSGAGGYLGYRLGRRQSWTEGQAIVTGLGSIFGPLVANGAFWTVAPNSAFSNHSLNYGSFLGLAGNAAGTWYAQRLVQNSAITNSGAFITVGTTIGGGLLGAGVGYLITTAYPSNSPSSMESWRWTTGLATLGVAGGFMLGVKLAKDVTVASQYQSSLRLNLDLASVAAGAMTYASSRAFSAPRLITISF